MPLSEKEELELLRLKRKRSAAPSPVQSSTSEREELEALRAKRLSTSQEPSPPNQQSNIPTISAARTIPRLSDEVEREVRPEEKPGLLKPGTTGEPDLLQRFAEGLTSITGRRSLEKLFKVDSSETVPHTTGGRLARGLGTGVGYGLGGKAIVDVSKTAASKLIPTVIKEGGKETLKRRGARTLTELGLGGVAFTGLEGDKPGGTSGAEALTEIGATGITSLSQLPLKKLAELKVPLLALFEGKPKTAVVEVAPKVIKEVGDEILDLPKGVKPTVEQSVQRFLSARKKIGVIRSIQKEAITKERAARFLRAEEIGEEVTQKHGAMAGYFAQLKALSGKMGPKEFGELKKYLTQDDFDNLFKMISDTNKLDFTEKLTAYKGLMKFMQGSPPTEGELPLLAEVFSQEMLGEMVALQPGYKKLASTATDIINLPKSVMSSFDLSAGRQAITTILTHPLKSAKALKDTLPLIFNEKAYEGFISSLRNHPLRKEMRQAGLQLSDLGPGFKLKEEEAFIGKSLSERIPLVGRGIAASNRAFAGFLNKLRVDTFTSMYQDLNTLGIREKYPDFAKHAAELVNHSTGVSKLPGGLDKIARSLNTLVFSPKFAFSRLQFFNPVNYLNPNIPPKVRIERAKQIVALGSYWWGMMNLAKLNGAKVEDNPTSTDFGKIKLGNTRIEVTGSFQPYVVLGARLLLNEATSPTSGKTRKYGEGYKPDNRLTALLRFGRGKMSPSASFVADFLAGEDFLGRPFNVPDAMAQRFVPLFIQDLHEAYQDDQYRGLLKASPGFIGAGITTFKPLTPVEKAKRKQLKRKR